MRIGRVLGVLLSAVFSLAVAVTPATASEGRWSCGSVPAGYTYVTVRADIWCEPVYYIQLPKTGLWACTVPAGFTYTATRDSSDCFAPRIKYLLAAL
ncbi:hypothetical protein AB0I60_05645 [Actinosynnema sp. NPDC050436]|uniref:hypothetical protein n=1 Tax=Actinosynnema sp. NPDC050436 TaxID=3155659 RepID=UPI0034069612